MLDDLATHHPSVTKVWVDARYQRSAVQAGAAHGIDVEVVSKPPARQGFQPLPRRWAVERTYRWLMLHRRLARDYETLPGRSRAMIHWAMTDNMMRRLTGESTPTWRDDHPVAGKPSLL